jgi:hypothetical protein
VSGAAEGAGELGHSGEVGHDARAPGSQAPWSPSSSSSAIAQSPSFRQ